MAQLFIKQAKQYAETRPSYPPELFQYIASKTPSHDLAWDVATGSGQAAQSLAKMYAKVIATDTSQKQLQYAPKLSNVAYKHTSPVMSLEEIQQNVASKASVDLVTIAQALHWFNLPALYQQVKWVLKNSDGVFAAWCYTLPEINDPVDKVLNRLYFAESSTYWDSARKMVDDKYTNIEFPFEPVDGADHTGPFMFVIDKVMNLDAILMYIRSWSAYQTAKEKGVELLGNDVIDDFRCAWDQHGDAELVVKFPVYLRIGKVGNSDD